MITPIEQPEAAAAPKHQAVGTESAYTLLVKNTNTAIYATNITVNITGGGSKICQGRGQTIVCA